MKNKLYFCFTEYAATCEGWSVWLSTEYSISVEGAKKAHQKRFNLNDFFVQGIEVFDVDEQEKEIIEILNNFFDKGFIKFLQYKHVKTREKQKIFAGFVDNFALSFYVNRS